MGSVDCSGAIACALLLRLLVLVLERWSSWPSFRVSRLPSAAGTPVESHSRPGGAGAAAGLPIRHRRRAPVGPGSAWQDYPRPEGRTPGRNWRSCPLRARGGRSRVVGQDAMTRRSDRDDHHHRSQRSQRRPEKQRQPQRRQRHRTRPRAGRPQDETGTGGAGRGGRLSPLTLATAGPWRPHRRPGVPLGLPLRSPVIGALVGTMFGLGALSCWPSWPGGAGPRPWACCSRRWWAGCWWEPTGRSSCAPSATPATRSTCPWPAHPAHGAGDRTGDRATAQNYRLALPTGAPRAGWPRRWPPWEG